jgi:lipoprotein-anchoring transpeptidase ErfK/SrfK
MSQGVPPFPRPSGRRRGVAALAMALLMAATGCLHAAPARAAGARVPASQRLVVLLRAHVARTRPNAHAHRIERVAARRPLTRVRTVLPVLGRAISSDGRSWVHVRLPGRPNAHKGWISTAQTKRRSTGWHLAVQLSTRRVTVFLDGRAQRRFRAVIGNPTTPTPRGRFFIEEGVALAADDAGGPFALATSARSEVLQEFSGGPGQIALHGLDNLPSDPLGSAASHGCVRLSRRAITWLVRRIGRGVPLTVSR